MAEYAELSERIVNLIRAQNWENGGAPSVDRDDAIDLVEQALKAAHSAGRVDAAGEMGDRLARTFDELLRRKSSAAANADAKRPPTTS